MRWASTMPSHASIKATTRRIGILPTCAAERGRCRQRGGHEHRKGQEGLSAKLGQWASRPPGWGPFVQRARLPSACGKGLTDTCASCGPAEEPSGDQLLPYMDIIPKIEPIYASCGPAEEPSDAESQIVPAARKQTRGINKRQGERQEGCT